MDEQQVSGASGAPVEGVRGSVPCGRSSGRHCAAVRRRRWCEALGCRRVRAGRVAVATKPVVRRGLAFGAAGGALALGLLAGGVTGGLIAAAQASSDTDTAAASTVEGAAYEPPPPRFRRSSRRRGASSPSTSDQAAASAASADQQVGVVTITSTLGYQNASSAGTGMVLTSNGLVLTNNHVIEGSTSIEVTIESTGASYVGHRRRHGRLVGRRAAAAPGRVGAGHGRAGRRQRRGSRRRGDGGRQRGGRRRPAGRGRQRDRAGPDDDGVDGRLRRPRPCPA